MRLFRKERTNGLSDRGEMHRLTVALHCKVRVVTDSLDADGGRGGATPFGERIATNTLREREPALQDFFVFVGVVDILEFIKKTVKKLSFRNNLIIRE